MGALRVRLANAPTRAPVRKPGILRERNRDAFLDRDAKVIARDAIPRRPIESRRSRRAVS
jgi:hypothetical protein